MQYSLGHRRPYNKVCSNYVMIQIMIIMFEHVRAELLRTFDHCMLNASQPLPHIRFQTLLELATWSQDWAGLAPLHYYLGCSSLTDPDPVK